MRATTRLPTTLCGCVNCLALHAQTLLFVGNQISCLDPTYEEGHRGDRGGVFLAWFSFCLFEDWRARQRRSLQTLAWPTIDHHGRDYSGPLGPPTKRSITRHALPHRGGGFSARFPLSLFFCGYASICRASWCVCVSMYFCTSPKHRLPRCISYLAHHFCNLQPVSRLCLKTMHALHS